MKKTDQFLFSRNPTSVRTAEPNQSDRFLPDAQPNCACPCLATTRQPEPRLPPPPPVADRCHHARRRGGFGERPCGQNGPCQSGTNRPPRLCLGRSKTVHAAHHCFPRNCFVFFLCLEMLTNTQALYRLVVLYSPSINIRFLGFTIYPPI